MLYGVVEVAIHLGSFRNVDLLQRGLYCVRVSLATEGGRVQGIPVSSITAPLTYDVPLPNPSMQLRPAVISDCGFTSRSFYIRYMEQIVQLNDCCQFRLEFDIGEGSHVTEVFRVEAVNMKIELLYLDVDTLDEAASSSSAGVSYLQIQDSTLDQQNFQIISTKMLRIHNVSLGLHDYVPVMFDEPNFSLLNVLVHSVLLDFRFRSSVSGGIGSDKQSARLQRSVTPSGEAPPLKVAPAHPNDTSDVIQMHQVYWDALLKSFNSLTQRVAQLATSSDDIVSRHDFVLPELELPSVPFSETISQGLTREQVVFVMLQDLNSVSCQIYHVWKKFLVIFFPYARGLYDALRATWEEKVIERWGESIFRETLNLNLGSYPIYNSNRDLHGHVAETLRKSLYYQNLKPLACEDPSLHTTPENHPIIFEQLCLPIGHPLQFPRRDASPNARRSPEDSPRLKDKIRERTDSRDSGSDPDIDIDELAAKIEDMERDRQGSQEGTTSGTAARDSPPLGRRDIDLEVRRAYEEHGRLHQGLPDAFESPFTTRSRSRGYHVVVFVHGFQGSAFDLRLLKDHFAVVFPDCKYLVSMCNEGHTMSLGIETMGTRLAHEIVRFVRKGAFPVKKISFVAHSLGALIARACLVSPAFRQYLDQLHVFVSLSCPHLGYIYNKNRLVDSAMWILRNFKKAEGLKQLTCTDDRDPHKCFLYQLSLGKGLEKFNTVFLISSPQDRYVPFHSSRIEMCPEAFKDTKQGQLYKEMVHNILRPLDACKVIRLDVVFGITRRDLQSAIGRAAHILFLESQPFFQMFLYSYKKHFEM